MLYFTRHGQTNHNLNKLLAGHCNIELNETGIRQAIETSEKYKNINIDIIYCSPLIRAKQTCEIINKEHDSKVIIKDELIERNFGIYESKNYECIDGEKCWNYFDNTYDCKIESLKNVFKRVHKFLDEIKEECKNKDVLIVAHNDIGRAIHCYFNGLPSDGNVRNINFKNGEIMQYSFKKML